MNTLSFKDYLNLTKPRICTLALLMALYGYYLGGGSGFPFSLLLGLALVGGASGILNQALEIQSDALMKRTCNRPLVRLPHALGKVRNLGLALGLVGICWLLVFVNPLTSVLAAATFFLYLAIYTPSKKRSALSLFIGAIPGALPPVMGYTSASSKFEGYGLLLFGMLFLWQIPHFLALSWLYREDYERAGIHIFPSSSKNWTFEIAILSTCLMIGVSLAPVLSHPTRFLEYIVGSFILGIGFLIFVLRWWQHPTPSTARVAFFGSLLYLPIWGGLLGFLWP